VLSDGSDVAILGLGPMISWLAENWPQRSRATVTPPPSSIPASSSPSTAKCSSSYARRVAAFVTFEDHVKMGGFGTAVVEALDEMGLAVPVVRIGWPDQFIEHGKVDALRAKYGLSVEAAYAQVLPLLAGRRRATLVAS
jgi:1-deoxy-D-xylulose-5-phosphate synthase